MLLRWRRNVAQLERVKMALGQFSRKSIAKKRTFAVISHIS